MARKVVSERRGLGSATRYAPPRGKRWVEERSARAGRRARVNSVLAMAEAAAAGVGAAVLPCFLGDLRPGLVRVGPLLAELDVDLWLLTHEDLRHSARVRAFIEVAAAELVKMRKLIEGGAAADGPS